MLLTDVLLALLCHQARSASAYERAFLFVEIGDQEGEWSIIFSNNRATQMLGECALQCAQACFMLQ